MKTSPVPTLGRDFPPQAARSAINPCFFACRLMGMKSSLSAWERGWLPVGMQRLSRYPGLDAMDVSWKKRSLAAVTVAGLLSLLSLRNSSAQQTLPAPTPLVLPDKIQDRNGQDRKNQRKPLPLAASDWEPLPSRLDNSDATIIDLASALSLAGV